MSNFALCRILHCVEFCTVSNSALCQILHCVEFCIVSNSALCRILHCVEFCTVSNSALCQILHCVEFCTVSNSALCQIMHCVEFCIYGKGFDLLLYSLYSLYSLYRWGGIIFYHKQMAKETNEPLITNAIQRPIGFLIRPKPTGRMLPNLSMMMSDIYLNKPN